MLPSLLSFFGQALNDKSKRKLTNGRRPQGLKVVLQLNELETSLLDYYNECFQNR